MAFESLKKIVGVFSSKEQPDKMENPSDNEVVDIQEHLYKEEIVTFVNNEFDRRQQERIPFELQWRLNMNFLNNHQYCDINNYTNTIEDMQKPFYWTEQEVYNHIAPIVETRLSKLGRVKPAMTVLPATSNLDDIQTTKVCKSILKATQRKLKISDKIDTANGWAEICGSVFYKNIWDMKAGQLIGYYGEEPLCEGDIDTSIVPAYEVYPDNQFNDGPDNCRSIIHAKAYTVSDIKEIWNVTVLGTEVDVYSLGMSNISLGGLGYNATIPFVAPTIKKDAAIVKEYQELPSKKYPNGRLIIVANDELLYYGDLPYKNGEDGKRTFSLVRQNCIDRPGCFWGSTVIERCIPIQRSYNAVKNRKHEFLNRCAIGVITYEDGTLLNEDELEEDGVAPGTLLPRKLGSAAPTFLNNGVLPPEFAQEENQLEEQFNLISGVSELSRNSTAPTGVGSGTALGILNEQDETRISLTANNIKKAQIENGKQYLRLYKQFATGPRMDRLVGDNNEVMIETWQRNMITSDDVVSETEDALSQSPAQKKKMVYDILQSGLANDPDTGKLSRPMRLKMLEMLDMGNWESTDDLGQLHTTRALKENMEIQQAEYIEVRDFDDHVIHIQEHDRFRLGNDYEKLKHDRPDLADIMDKHVLLHKQMIDITQQQGLQRQMALQQQMNPQPQQVNLKQ